ncbi:hypothetical protein ONZ45_g13651 [Pleurotus djamor]|nr:hypothetical protein ONZ45_g13651 [Pleurotus djamor]
MSASPRPTSPLNRQDADMILRSSDGVEFRVHKVILSIASPFFNDMFSMPQPKSSLGRKLDLEIVPFDEDSGTLDLVLRYCYPIHDPVVPHSDVLLKVLRAVDKYQVDRALGLLERAYIKLNKDDIETNPVKSYALACQYDWDDLRQVAVKASLLLAHSQIHTQFKAIDCSPLGNDSVKLLRYHFKCCTAAQDFLASALNAYNYPSAAANNGADTLGPLAVLRMLELEGDNNGNAYHSAEQLGLARRLKAHVNSAVGDSDFGLPF